MNSSFAWLRPLIAAAALFLVLPSAIALEVKEFSAPRQKVQVGESFQVRLRVDTNWLEPSECSVVVMPDGLTGDDLAYRPTLRWNTIEDWWQLGEMFRVHVRAQSGEVKKGLMEFSWSFNTPGKHSLRLDPELSPCKFEREWKLEFDVMGSDWSALDAYFLAPTGKDVGRSLSGQIQLNDRWRGAEFAAAEKDLQSLKEAIASFGPKKWEEWQSQVLQPALRPLGIQSPRFDSVDDRYDEPMKWVSEGRRFREGEGLMVLGRERAWVEKAINSGEWVLLGRIDMTQATGHWQAQQHSARLAQEEGKRKTRQIVAELPTAQGKFTALRVDDSSDKSSARESRLCAKIDGSESGYMVAGYRWSAAFSAWAKVRQGRGFDEVRPNLEALYADLKSGSCTHLIVKAEDALAFVNAMQRDGLAFDLFDLKTRESLFPEFQAVYGFKSPEAARMALEFAPGTIPDANHADTWVKFGLRSKGDFEKVVSRMNASAYASGNRFDFVSRFLEDEQSARKAGTSAVAVKKKREAKEAAQAAADRERDLKSYPYRAELTCNNGPYGALPVYTCLTSSNANSSVSLQNCGRWSNLDYDRLAGNVASIELCPSFEIKAQNTSEFVLTLVVKDKRSGKVLSHQTATRYRYVAVRN
jgi:hypothetical protein